VVGNRVIEIEPAEPPVGEVEPRLLTQLPLGADAEAVADDKHPDQQLGINRRPSDVAVEWTRLFVQIVEHRRHENVDPAQQVALRDHIIEPEFTEKARLLSMLSPHHRRIFPLSSNEQDPSFSPSRKPFSTASAQSSRSNQEKERHFILPHVIWGRIAFRIILTVIAPASGCCATILAVWRIPLRPRRDFRAGEALLERRDFERDRKRRCAGLSEGSARDHAGSASASDLAELAVSPTQNHHVIALGAVRKVEKGGNAVASSSDFRRPANRGPGVEALRAKWGWIVALGTIYVLVGLIALYSVVTATVASVFVVGIMMLIAGVAEVINAFQVKSWGKFFLWILLGLLYILAGFVTFENPLLVAAVLTLVLGAALVASGIMRIILAFNMKEETPWIAVVFSGVVTFLLGLIILAHWPVSSLYVLGLFLGIDLVFAGLGWIGVGMGLESFAYEAHQKVGYDAGRAEGYESGRKAGYDTGRAEGYEAGRKAGRDEPMTPPDAPPSSEA
jgi:uncharacterized membrane protein HdeD (DUF308 family)